MSSHPADYERKDARVGILLLCALGLVLIMVGAIGAVRAIYHSDLDQIESASSQPSHEFTYGPHMETSIQQSWDALKAANPGTPMSIDDAMQRIAASGTIPGPANVPAPAWHQQQIKAREDNPPQNP